MINKFKKIFSQEQSNRYDDTFIEIKPEDVKPRTNKIMLKHFVLNDFSDVKPVLDSLREGYTIALIKVKPLREKSISDLKRAIFKIKRTCEAIDGDVMGVDQNLILAVPSYVSIHKESSSQRSDNTYSSTDNVETYY